MWNVELFDHLISDTAVQSDCINNSSSTSQDCTTEIKTSKIGPLIWAHRNDSQLFIDELSENTQVDLDQSISSIVDQVIINEVIVEDNERRPSRNCMKNGSSGKNLSAAQLFQELCGNKGNPSLNPHSLISPFAYGDPIGPAPTEKQPFSIVIHPQVGLICDFHAHLSDAEVIGLLAGKYDEEKKSLYIQAPFPCTAIDRLDDDGSTDVELDPEAEWKARETISNLGMQVVGWYHSHPRFRPDPSLTDVFNQEQHQCMDHDNTTDIKPFVGLIVSTFDPSLTTYVSHHQWFHVRPYTATVSKRTVYMPMLLNVTYATLSSTTVSSKSIENLEDKFDSIISKGNDEQPSDDKKVVESDETVGEIYHPPTASEEAAPMDEVEMDVVDNPIESASPIKNQKPRKRAPAGSAKGRQRTKSSKIGDKQPLNGNELSKLPADLDEEDPSANKSLDQQELVKLKSENPSAEDNGENYQDSGLDDSSSNIVITPAAIADDVTTSVDGVANECKESDAVLESEVTLVVAQPSQDTAMPVDSEHQLEDVEVSAELLVPETTDVVIAIPGVEESMDTSKDVDTVLELPSSDVLAVPMLEVTSDEHFDGTSTVIGTAESEIPNTDNNAELLPAETLATDGITIKSESEPTALASKRKPRQKIPEVVVVELPKRTVKAREIYDDSVYRKRKQRYDAQQISLPTTTTSEDTPGKGKRRQPKSLPQADAEAEAEADVAVAVVDQPELPEQSSNIVSIVENTATELNVKDETGNINEENSSDVDKKTLPDKSNGETVSAETLDIVERSSNCSVKEPSKVDHQELHDLNSNTEVVVDSVLAAPSEALDIAMQEEESSSAKETLLVDQQGQPDQSSNVESAIANDLDGPDEIVDEAVDEESAKESAVVEKLEGVGQSNGAISSSETLDAFVKEEDSSSSSSEKNPSTVDQQDLIHNSDSAVDSSLAVSSEVVVKEEGEMESATVVEKQELPDQSDGADVSDAVVKVEGSGSSDKEPVKAVRKRKEKTKTAESNEVTASSRERRPLAKKTYDDFDTDTDIVKRRTNSSAKKQSKSATKGKSDDESLRIDTLEETPAASKAPGRRGKPKKSLPTTQSDDESDSGKPSQKEKADKAKPPVSSKMLSKKRGKKSGLAHSHDDDEDAGEPKPKKKALASKKPRATDPSALESSINVDVISLLKDRSQPFTPHGRKVLFSVAPEYRYLTLCIISLGCYYRQSKYKVDLMRKWKDHTKLEKLRVSATVWAKYLGLSISADGPSSASATTADNGIQAREEGDGGNDAVSSAKKKGRGKNVVRTRSALSSSDEGVAATVRLIPELIEFLRLCWQPPPAPQSATPAAVTTKAAKKKRSSNADTDGESTKKKKTRKPSAGKNRAD